LGVIIEKIGSEESEVVDEILTLPAPVSLADLKGRPDMEATACFLKRTNASLLVPLVSGERLAGVITVGSDRGGSPYSWEAREFLLVLGGHAAGEFHKAGLLTTLVTAKEDEAFRAFSTFVLHDLKNFASTLSLIAQNATKFHDNPEFQQDTFHSIYETAEKMKRLCNSLRSFSASIASNKKLEDLNRIVGMVVDKELVGIAERIHLELAPVPLILLDAEEVARVLQNLVLNAQQAISSEGSIWIRTAARDGLVELVVSDDGKGMSRQFLDNELFLPFHTTKSDGLGIGLFQTQKIIKAHNGNIRVESVEGKGTTIKMEFPGGARESGITVEQG
jgi:putative PEP-CTERM system histidine kinase